MNKKVEGEPKKLYFENPSPIKIVEFKEPSKDKQISLRCPIRVEAANFNSMTFVNASKCYNIDVYNFNIVKKQRN